MIPGLSQMHVPFLNLSVKFQIFIPLHPAHSVCIPDSWFPPFFPVSPIILRSGSLFSPAQPTWVSAPSFFHFLSIHPAPQAWSLSSNPRISQQWAQLPPGRSPPRPDPRNHLSQGRLSPGILSSLWSMNLSQNSHASALSLHCKCESKHFIVISWKGYRL